MRLQSIKKGFTLIELLVVITIIGILAVGGVSVFTTQLQGARDSTRINDMKLLETGIHQYFNDEGVYPPDTDSTPSGSFTGKIAIYLSKELEDPKKGKSICWNTSTDNTYSCGGYYTVQDDAFGLPDSAFKLGVSFEKLVNFTKKAANSADGGTEVQLLETFAGAGAEAFRIGSGTTTSGAIYVY